MKKTLAKYNIDFAQATLSGRPKNWWMCITSIAIYTVSRKKGATDFFAVTFTNIDGFS